MRNGERPSLERQLLSNQIWETVGFMAKAAFVLGLTPWMIRTWGAQGYGEFALASSAFVLLSLVDLGIRARTRVALCAAGEKNRAQWLDILAHSAFTFVVIGALTIGASLFLTATGVVNSVFKISASDRNLLFVTTTMSILVMVSGLLLEPLVAMGRIGRLKLATAAGWLCAIPAVALALAARKSVIAAVAVWLGCLLGANVVLLLLHRGILQRRGLPNRLEFGRLIAPIREGFWFNISTAAWTAKTYGATLVIFGLDGAAAAGTFFILLRLSEIISALGAISCDVSLGELAQASSVERRLAAFKSSYSWATVLCVHLAVLVGFVTKDFYQSWLHSPAAVPGYAGALAAVLGLSSGFNRKSAYAAMGLGLAKLAAKCGLAEAICFLGAIALLPSSFELWGRVAIASGAVVALWPMITTISRQLGTTPKVAFLRPLASIVPFVASSGLLLLGANMTGGTLTKGFALAVAVALMLFNITRQYRIAAAQTRHSSAPISCSGESAVLVGYCRAE